MRKFAIQVVGLVLLAIGCFYVTFNGNTAFSPLLNNNQQKTEKQQYQIGNILIKVELADTHEKRQTGLGGRDALAESEGMLFIFAEKKQYQFWMKGMKIPLDFIFIRDSKVVDFIQKVDSPVANTPDNQLPIYQPIEQIDTLLEVNAGFIEINNIKVGDTATLVSNSPTP